MIMEFMETLACVTIPVNPRFWRREYRFYLVVSKRFRVYRIVFIVPCFNLRVAWRLLKKYLKERDYNLVEFQSVTCGGRIYTKIK